MITGTYDKKVQWFDLDLSTLPYQVLRYHQGGVRDVQYHRRYPLFASCGDDNSVTVSHGRTVTVTVATSCVIMCHFQGWSTTIYCRTR